MNHNRNPVALTDFFTTATVSKLAAPVGNLHKLEGASIAKTVELIAEMAVLLDYLKPLLPGHMVERAEFVVSELHDIAQVMDGAIGLEIYQIQDRVDLRYAGVAR